MSNPGATAANSAGAKPAADPTKAADKTPLASKPPPFMMKPLVQDNRYIKILIYGPFGVGKTSLAGSAVDVPSMNDVIMVDAESGSMSIQESPRIKNKEALQVIRCTDFLQVASVHDFLKAHCKFRDANDVTALKNLQSRVTGVPVSEIDEPFRFRTAIVDSLTEIDTFSMYELLGIKVDMKLDAEVEVAQFAEFRKNNQRLQLLVRAYRDLPMNIILVCSTQYVQDELKRMHFTPSLTGKLSAQVQGFVDIVGYIQTGKLTEGQVEAPRRLWLQPVGQFDAKNRKGSFREAYIDDPSMAKLMKVTGLAS